MGTPSVVVTATEAKDAVKEAEDSESVSRMARFGLLCRGVTWLVVGVLALDIATGDQGGRSYADRTGAFAAIKGQPLGGLALLLLGLGFIGYAVWRLLEGVAGHRDSGKAWARWGKRAASLGRGVVYAGLAFSTLRFLFNEQRRDATKPLTARAMEQPGGVWLVGAVGTAFLVGGAVMAVRGLRHKYDKKLMRMGDRMHAVVRIVATTGLVGRGFTFALVGWFLLDAALNYDPKQARGLDAALRTLAGQPLGPWLLGTAAAGLVSFGLWSLAEARWRRV